MLSRCPHPSYHDECDRCAAERRGRERPTHDVTTYGGRSTPCFCYADQNHAVGQEQRTRPIPDYDESWKP